MRIHGSGLNNADVSKLEMLGVTTVQLVNLTAKHTFAREEIEELRYHSRGDNASHAGREA